MTRTNSVTSRVTACVDGSEGSDRTTKTFLPSVVHYAHGLTRPCPECGHVHRGEDGWCDAPVCGDGCCHCPCYHRANRRGPGLLNHRREGRKG